MSERDVQEETTKKCMECNTLNEAALYRHSECMKLLIDAGADVNQCNNGGSSPIYGAARRGHSEIVKLLIVAGANVHLCNNKGRPPILGAAISGHIECVNLLIEAGVDVNLCDDSGRSLIYRAAINGHIECVNLLIEAGADVNLCDDDGCSPIYMAVLWKRNECLFLLWYSGGDIHIKNNHDQTALDIAIHKNRPKTVELLCSIQDGTIDKDEWILKLRNKGLYLPKTEWEKDEHKYYPEQFQTEVKQMLLMWMHDQYEEGECEGIRWNELPWEVVEKIIKWRAILEGNKLRK